jgi:hypothetical protein
MLMWLYWEQRAFHCGKLVRIPIPFVYSKGMILNRVIRRNSLEIYHGVALLLDCRMSSSLNGVGGERWEERRAENTRPGLM